MGPARATGVLRAAEVGGLLTLGVGEGEEAADGEHEDGAEAEAKPGGDEEAGEFASGQGGDDDEPEGEAGTSAGADALPKNKAGDSQQKEEGVDAYFDAHPPAKRD